MDELFLRNLNYGFYYSGAYECENGYLTSFYNSDNNNMILFDTNDSDEITVESICNSTVSYGAYEYLIDVLNNNKDILVYWSQVEGTTSDYTIYYNSDNESLIDETLELPEALKVDNFTSYKFNEVKNRKQTKKHFKNSGKSSKNKA